MRWPMQPTKTPTRSQRTSRVITASMIIATTFDMPAMVGRRSGQLKMPRPAAYGGDVGGDKPGVSDTGMKCGAPAAGFAGTATGQAAGTATATSHACLRQPCTRFAFNPCAIDTFATDAPGAAHCASTIALNCALCRLREPTLSSAIVSTYFLDGHDR